MNSHLLPLAFHNLGLTKTEFYNEIQLEQEEKEFEDAFNELTNPQHIAFVAPGFEKKEEEEDDEEEQDMEMGDESEREFDEYPEELQSSLEF